MCGIAGILSFGRKVELNDLQRMTDSISHRGPDAEGHWIDLEARIGLGHRRLSIIDLSADANQPMHSADGRYTIVFNGEIYNYVELRDRLEKQGVVFRSKSDTEVLLLLYERLGAACLDSLDGMFALAIWDSRKQELFCARDRFGEKPFFYSSDGRSRFLFASEMKALFELDLPKRFDESLLYGFFMNSYMVSNPRVPSATFYKDVEKLPPAHYMRVSASGETLECRRYWDIDYKKVDDSIGLDAAAEKFRELFSRSVERRLRSDVPVGSSLSGGLDSSTIVTQIDRGHRKEGLVQKTFSARFKDFAKDEGRFMELVIASTRVDSHFTWPDVDQMLDAFDRLCHHQEEPFGSASVYAQWEVMKLASQNGVTVLLDGQGADETMAGYIHFFKTYMSELFVSNTSLYEAELKEYRSRYEPGFRGYFDSRSPRVMLSQFKGRALSMLGSPRRDDGILKRDFAVAFHNDTGLQDAPIRSLNEHLYRSTMGGSGLEDLLRYADRNSMAFSREVRLPFLSHELVEFIFSLPPSFKIRNGWSKYLMRVAFEDILPQEIAWRRDKVGYEPPQKDWMGNSRMLDYIQSCRKKLEDKGILDPSAQLGNEAAWQVAVASAYI